MNINDFINSLKKYAAKTPNIRVSEADHWDAALNPIPNTLANKVDNLIILIQKNIEQNNLCDKNKEYLLIFCCDATIKKNKPHCILRTLIRPLVEINNTMPTGGKSLSLYINYENGEVMNEAKAMAELDLANNNGAAGQPIIYGNYNDNQLQETHTASSITLANQTAAAPIFTK